MTDETDFARRSEVAALRRRVAVLEAAFVHLVPRGTCDARLGAVLAAIVRFCGLVKPWTVGELLEDARRGDPGLWLMLDELVGDRDPAIALGKWLRRHENVEADDLRLERITRESGAWLYRVVRVGEL